jgi:hypothetical protein
VGYYPYSRITTPPVPASSGTAFSVMAETGDRFPAPPWTAITWADQTLPDLGVDAETFTVLTIDGDDFTCDRPGPRIAIPADAQLAVLAVQGVSSVGEPLVLTSEEFPVTDSGVELHVRDAQGSVSTYNPSANAGSGGGEVYSQAITPARAGQHFYRFGSDQRVQAEQDFYVRFSEVT